MALKPGASAITPAVTSGQQAHLVRQSRHHLILEYSSPLLAAHDARAELLPAFQERLMMAAVAINSSSNAIDTLPDAE